MNPQATGSTTGTELLVAAMLRLKSVGIENPSGDARILLAFALGVDRSRLTLILPDEVLPEQAEAYGRAIEARAARQPVAQIIGYRAFYGRDFIVTGDVLDPRPDTELLIEAALAAPFDHVLDLGTGSGCILLTLLKETEGTWGVGTDLSQEALDVARTNRARLELDGPAVLRHGSWYDALDQDDGLNRFDLIVSNPPYISQDEMAQLDPDVVNWEPHMALSPGGDGLDAYREITAHALAHLSERGRLVAEIGKDQGAAVSALFLAAGLNGVEVLKDLNGHDRVVVGRAAQPAS